MTKIEKLINRLLRKPVDFSYSELSSVLAHLAYIELNRGKTSGSRRAFISQSNKHIIRLHKPHPKEILKMYQIEYIIEELRKEDLI